MNHFFITGLPRSGHAWMANYLSYGSCMCLFDAFKNNAPADIRDTLGGAGVLAGGVSDPSSVFILNKIDKVFPDAKWVVITRPPKEVEESCKAINFPFVDFTAGLKQLMSSRKVLKVPFAKMFDKADEIGRYVYEDWVCPPWRKEQAKSLNVQLHWGRVSDQFKVPEVTKDTDTITPAKIEYLKLMKEIVNDDAFAMRFLMQAMQISELYKRLDQGRPIDIKLAKHSIEALVTEWMVSPFVRSYSASLSPVLVACAEKYNAHVDDDHCPIDLDLTSVVTYIFKGSEGVKQYMPRIRELTNQVLLEK